MEHANKEKLQEGFPQLGDELLDDIATESIFKHIGEGDEALRSGQYIKSTMLLLSGLLKIYREDEEGREFLMYYLRPGDACAMSMMCSARVEKSQVLAKAVEDSEVVLIPSHVSEAWLTKYSTWHTFVIFSYRQRFEELLTTLDSVVFKALDERLLFYLQRHLEAIGNEMRLSHQQIALELNSSREVISRLLKKLEQTGALSLHRNYIRIHDLSLI